MSVAFKGNCEWGELSVPVPTKNEWGMDVLNRDFSGRADKYENFIKGLKQGDSFSFSGGQFYLQTWSSQPHRSFPVVTLSYKGLLSGKVPDPVFESDTSPKSCTKTVTSGSSPRTYEITYISTQKIWRYITNDGGTIPPPELTYDLPQIVTSFYVDDDGKKKSGMPAGITIIGIVEGNRKSKVFGTPFWENQVTASGVILP